MKILENLKLNTWYGITLYLGVLLIIGAFYFDKDFLEEKHVFGLGIGMVLVGLSMIMSEKHVSTIKPPNFYTGGPALLSWVENRHNVFTIILMIIGICLIGLFGFLIVKGLI